MPFASPSSAAVSAAEWSAIADQIYATAASLNEVGRRDEVESLIAEMQSAEVDQANVVNSLLHGLIVRDLVSRGLARAKESRRDQHDLDLFGYPGEIKTTKDVATVRTNLSYLNTSSAPRLTIVVNFALLEGAVHIFLIRAGWLGPNDYIDENPNNAKRQIAKLQPDSFYKLSAIDDFDTESFPATLIPGYGAAKERDFDVPLTVHEVRRAIFTTGMHRSLLSSMTPEALADKVSWRTFGSGLPTLLRRAA